MNPYIQNQQIEELVWVDPYDSLAEDSTIMDEEDYSYAVSYTHLRAHETSLHLVCRLLLEKKK